MRVEVAAIARTAPVAPGLHFSSARGVAWSGAALWRAVPPPGAPGGRTAVNWPPTYITPPEKVIARTVPFVCQDELGGNGFAARACPELPASTSPAHTAPRNSLRRMAARYPGSRT